MDYTVPISITDYTKKDIDTNIKTHDYGKHALSFLCDNIIYDYACLKFKRPDGEVITYDFKEPYFVLNGAEIDLAGYIDAEISFFDNEGRITSNCFTFTVQTDISADGAIKENPKAPILDQLLIELNKAEEERQQAELRRDKKIKDFEGRFDTSIQQAILDSWEVKV